MKQSEDDLPVRGWFNFGQELSTGKHSREIKDSEMSSGENCQLLKRQHSPASLPPGCPESCICVCIQVKPELNTCRCFWTLTEPGKEQNMFHPFLNVEVLSASVCAAAWGKRGCLPGHVGVDFCTEQTLPCDLWGCVLSFCAELQFHTQLACFCCWILGCKQGK